MRIKKLLQTSLLTCFLVSTAMAQQNTGNSQAAKNILSNVSKNYQSYEGVKVDFDYILENESSNVQETHSGTLFVKTKSNKYKIILSGMEMFSDGKNRYNYIKEAKEIQINSLESDDEGVNPAKIFTMFEKGWKYDLKEEKKDKDAGGIIQLIDLFPLETKTFFKVELSVDKKRSSLKQIKIFDKNGNRYTYKIKKFISEPKMSDDIFAFNPSKFPNTEIVDLR